MPRALKGDKVVAADSYFDSVKYVKYLEDMGLDFIGVFNHTSHQYQMSHL